MKLHLSNEIISNLSFDGIPIGIRGKKPITTPNEPQKPYIVFDSNPNTPRGFGVRVGKESKTFVLMTRIKGRKTTISIGTYPTYDLQTTGDFNAARAANRRLQEIEDGIDPVAEKRAKRERDNAIPTLGQLFDSFLEDYKTSAKRKPKENTLNVIEKARSRFLTKDVRELLRTKKISGRQPDSGLLAKKANEITSADLKKEFDKIAIDEGHLTAAEQTMRWVSAVYNHRIRADEDNGVENPVIARNPVGGIRREFRTRSELRKATQGKRNPIDNTPDKLGAFLSAIFNATRGHRLGADYLLANLLVGSRKSEPSQLKWFSKMSPKERESSSYVDVASKTICFRDTKNRNDHFIPMGPVLASMMEERFASSESPYVFPPYRANKNRKVPYYKDNKAFIKRIREESGVYFTMHDLRRTFSRIVNTMNIPTITLKRLLNHIDGDVTDLYAQPTIDDLRPYMNQIEAEILKHAPFKTGAEWVAGISGDTEGN